MTTYSFTAQTLTLNASGNATAVSSSVVELYRGGDWGGFWSGYSNWDDVTDTSISLLNEHLIIDGVPVEGATFRWALADDGVRQTVVLEILSGDSLTVVRVDGAALPFGTLNSANRWLDNADLNRIESGDWNVAGPMLLTAFDSFATLTENDEVHLSGFLGDLDGDWEFSVDEAPAWAWADYDGDGFLSVADMTPLAAFTGAGNDTISGSYWFDSIRGGDGDDIINTGGNMGWDASSYAPDFGANIEELWAQVGFDLPADFNWNDFAEGGAGNDTIEANQAGNAWIDGGDGDDRVVLAAEGNFEVHGGAGNDQMQGGNLSFEAYFGDDGNDTIIGGNGTNGGSGGAGNDSIVGGANLDDFNGGLGRDRMFGGGGADYLSGDEGNDFLVGGAGQDRLIGGADSDNIEGGAGRDDLSGGDGADVFVFRAGFGRDVLRDFDAAAGDVLRIARALTAGASTSAEVLDQFAIVEFGHVVLDFGSGNRIILMSVASEADLSGAIVVF